MKPKRDWVRMDDIAHTQSNDGMLKNAAPQPIEELGTNPGPSSSSRGPVDERDGVEEAREEGGRRPWRRRKTQTYSHAHFRVYKRRWLGLAQLVLLNIVVSWDVGLLFRSVAIWSGWMLYHMHVFGMKETTVIPDEHEEVKHNAL